MPIAQVGLLERHELHHRNPDGAEEHVGHPGPVRPNDDRGLGEDVDGVLETREIKDLPLKFRVDSLQRRKNFLLVQECPGLLSVNQNTVPFLRNDLGPDHCPKGPNLLRRRVTAFGVPGPDSRGKMWDRRNDLILDTKPSKERNRKGRDLTIDGMRLLEEQHVGQDFCEEMEVLGRPQIVHINDRNPDGIDRLSLLEREGNRMLLKESTGCFERLADPILDL